MFWAVAISLIVALALLIAAWLSHAAVRATLTKWRRRLVTASLWLFTATSFALLLDLLAAVFDWAFLSRAAFELFVLSCFTITILAFFLALFGKGLLRCSCAGGTFVLAYLWALVAAWSWI
jgi:hypothetical protein